MRRWRTSLWISGAGLLLAGCANLLDVGSFQDEATGGGSQGGAHAGGAHAGGGGSTGGATPSGGGGSGGAATECGNHEVEPPEQCDDGNDTDGDGCADCSVECDQGAGELRDGETGHCYQFVEFAALQGPTWEEARLKCQDWGLADLAVLSTQAELDLLTTRFPRQFWVGADDKDTEGDWHWIDGSAVDGDLWGSNQPSNTGLTEHCATFSEIHGGLNDRTCSSRLDYLCERPGPADL